jgi:hypothetical protein
MLSIGLSRGTFSVVVFEWFGPKLLAALFLTVYTQAGCLPVHAQEVISDPCPRPAQGNEVPEPEDLRSQNGVLQVELSLHNYKEKDGTNRYCYLLPDGHQWPTLRLSPGDLLILDLNNDLSSYDSSTVGNTVHHPAKSSQTADPCTSGVMSATSTNLHFRRRGRLDY